MIVKQVQRPSPWNENYSAMSNVRRFRPWFMNPPPCCCLRSFGLSNRTIGRPAARKRIRRKPPPPQIHPFLGGRDETKEGDNRALHFTGTKWRENVGGEWKNDRAVSERDHAAPALLLLSCAISFLRFSKRKKFDGKLRMRAKRCTRWL